jgi:hypothetical protein
MDVLYKELKRGFGDMFVPAAATVQTGRSLQQCKELHFALSRRSAGRLSKFKLYFRGLQYHKLGELLSYSLSLLSYPRSVSLNRTEQLR